MSASTPKLLVIRLGALGDLLHASASVRYVREAMPSAECHWLTSPLYRDLVGAFDGVGRVWTYDKKTGLAGLWPLRQALARQGFTHIINWQPSIKTGLLAMGLFPAKVTTYHKQKLTVKGLEQRRLERRHAVDDFYATVQSAFPQLPARMPESMRIPRLVPLPESSAPGSSDDTIWIGIIPGVGQKRANRAWPKENYLELMQRLLAADPRRQIRLIGGPEEAQWAESLVISPQVENRVGKTDFLTTAAELAQCRLVIGGDTGPTHLAAAVGVPMLGIYGPTSVLRTGPLDAFGTLAITPPESLSCWPCEYPECPLTGSDHLACMSGITVDAVVAQAENMLQQT